MTCLFCKRLNNSHRGLWGEAPEAERFLEFKLNLVHAIQLYKLIVGLFFVV